MIRRIVIRHFKRFEDETFELADAVILAGPNNAGKTTLLQAIVTWSMGLAKWLDKQRSGTKATKRTGVPITRKDFTAVPLREMNLLWEGRQVAGGGDKPGSPRLLEISLEGGEPVEAGKTWVCGLEFQYANPELVYVRPLGARQLTETSLKDFPPEGARQLQIVHVPALSGIERDEPRRDHGFQELLIGQGRPGEILRNLLLEVSQGDPNHWEELIGDVRRLFNVDLLKPQYSAGQPFIVCEYREGETVKALDLANAGSGFLQVLLLLAFFYARPATVLLLDEPDAHLHVILQKEVYELLRHVASQKGCQLIIATHSEVLLDSTSPERVLGFIGAHPRLLSDKVERDQLREALKRLTTTDLMLGKELGTILYVEGQSDERILGEWARILDHPAATFLQRPYSHWLGGRSLKEAKEHFFALRAAYPKMKGVCLLDGDNKEEPDDEMTKADLRVLRWRRYEIENYLIVPEAIVRFCEGPEPDLFTSEIAKRARQYLEDQLPPAALRDPHADSVLRTMKASDGLLVPLLERSGKPTPAKDLYLVAAVMRADEIHREVLEKLDAISAHLLGPDQT